MNPIFMVLMFVVFSLVGYKLIKNVPAVLHTPLMSGMNALSGVAILGALTATGAAVHTNNRILGGFAVFLAMLNIAGGFGVTHRMLCMFRKRQVQK